MIALRSRTVRVLLTPLLTFSGLALKDLLRTRPPSGERDEHLRAAGEWFKRAHNLPILHRVVKLSDLTGSDEYRHAALPAMSDVARYQDIHTANSNVRGVIKGSQPIWGRSARFRFPNWPAKFLVDAMLLWARWL